MRVNPASIAPSQNFLKPGTVQYIFECLHNGDIDKLPPTPILRKVADGRLVAIDGHNLIAVMYYLHKDISVHIATSPADGILATSDANKARNADLKDKYDTVLQQEERVRLEGIGSFADLIAKYSTLFDQAVKSQPLP